MPELPEDICGHKRRSTSWPCRGSISVCWPSWSQIRSLRDRHLHLLWPERVLWATSLRRSPWQGHDPPQVSNCLWATS